MGIGVNHPQVFGSGLGVLLFFFFIFVLCENSPSDSRIPACRVRSQHGQLGTGSNKTNTGVMQAVWPGAIWVWQVPICPTSFLNPILWLVLCSTQGSASAPCQLVVPLHCWALRGARGERRKVRVLQGAEVLLPSLWRMEGLLFFKQMCYFFNNNKIGFVFTRVPLTFLSSPPSLHASELWQRAARAPPTLCGSAAGRERVAKEVREGRGARVAKEVRGGRRPLPPLHFRCRGRRRPRGSMVTAQVSAARPGGPRCPRRGRNERERRATGGGLALTAGTKRPGLGSRA